MFFLTFDGHLNTAPLKDQLENVLDAGCGTGVWTIDFGKMQYRRDVTTSSADIA
jgi:predicted RNA methylase